MVLKPEDQKNKKSIQILKMHTYKYRIWVKKQHSQSEMRAFLICHLSQSLMRLIKLLK